MEFLEQIVERVVEHLQEKDIEISKEELLEVLSSPAKKALPLSSGGGGCIYTPNRGNQCGIPCGKPVSAHEHCEKCLQRKCVRKKLGLDGTTPAKTTVKKKTVKKETTSSPLKFKFSGAKKEFVDKTTAKFKLEPLEKAGHYYFPEENFIVRKEPNGTYLALGFGETEVERPLSEEEKKRGLELGLRVLADVEEEEE